MFSFLWILTIGLDSRVWFLPSFRLNLFKLGAIGSFSGRIFWFFELRTLDFHLYDVKSRIFFSQNRFWFDSSFNTDNQYQTKNQFGCFCRKRLTACSKLNLCLCLGLGNYTLLGSLIFMVILFSRGILLTAFYLPFLPFFVSPQRVRRPPL